MKGLILQVLHGHRAGEQFTLTPGRTLTLGREKKNDIVLIDPSVSRVHCEFTCTEDSFAVADRQSRNGIKVNGSRVKEKRIDPGDVLHVARHKYQVQYSPSELGAVGPPPPETSDADIFKTSLMERAGLQKRDVRKVREDYDQTVRYDVNDDRRGQLKKDRGPI